MSTSSGSPEPTEATSSLSPNNEPMPSQAANAHPPPAQPKSWLGQAAKPDRLDVSIDDVEHFRIWKRRWDGYYALSGLSQVDNLTQYHVLMSCLADETIRVVDNLPLQNGEHQSVTAIVALLEKHMKGHTNIVVEHRNFLCRQQQLGERFDDFLTALRDLSRNCSFCSPCRETLLRDRIVIGTHDTEVVQRLLAEKDLTLEDAIRICRSEEAAKRDTMSLSADSFGEPVPVTASANRLGARPPRPDSPWTGRNTPLQASSAYSVVDSDMLSENNALLTTSNARDVAKCTILRQSACRSPAPRPQSGATEQITGPARPSPWSSR